MKTKYIILLMLCFLHSELSSGQQNSALLDLTLKTSDNKDYNFSDVKNNKATVLIFFLADCPASQNYTLTINKLIKKYSDKNVSFQIVFPDTYSS